VGGTAIPAARGKKEKKQIDRQQEDHTKVAEVQVPSSGWKQKREGSENEKEGRHDNNRRRRRHSQKDDRALEFGSVGHNPRGTCFGPQLHKQSFGMGL
jgi:hypothetical protein